MQETDDLEFKKKNIRKQKCFTKLNEDEVDVLATLLVETPFAVGDVIVKEGDRVDSVYIILYGKADVFTSRLENHIDEFTKIAALKEGDAIGLSDEGFYSLTGLRTATVVAATEMVTLKLSVAMFRGFALAYPHASEVMRKQAEKL